MSTFTMDYGVFVSLLICIAVGFVSVEIWVRVNKVLDERRRAEEKLERTRILLGEYQRWLAEFPAVSLVLENLETQIEGSSVHVGWPPSDGPWDVAGLREVLRRICRMAPGEVDAEIRRAATRAFVRNHDRKAGR